MATALGGAVGGLLATGAMLLVRLARGDREPLTGARVVARLRGTDPARHRPAGLLLQLGYGAAGGVVLATSVPRLGLRLDPMAVGVALGLAFGLLMLLVDLLCWRLVVLRERPGLPGLVGSAAAHAVYGGVLGGVLSLFTYT